MIRLFKHYIPHAVLLLGTIDVLLLGVAAEAGWQLRAGQIAMHLGGAGERAGQLAGFSAMMLAAMIAVGVYGPDALRFAIAIALGFYGLAGVLMLLASRTLERDWVE